MSTDDIYRAVIADLHRAKDALPPDELTSDLDAWRDALVKIAQDADATLSVLKASEKAAQAKSIGLGRDGIATFLATSEELAEKRRCAIRFKNGALRRHVEVKALIAKSDTGPSRDELGMELSRQGAELARQGILLRAIAEKLGASS